jgi:hypothetical protein
LAPTMFISFLIVSSSNQLPRIRRQLIASLVGWFNVNAYSYQPWLNCLYVEDFVCKESTMQLM